MDDAGTDEDIERRRVVAERAARAGGEVALADFRREIDVETKASKTDVVTHADRTTQRRVIEVIRETYPDDPVVGEEEDTRKTVPDEGAAWVVDPIDGTANFVRGTQTWATSVAAVVDGEPVAACNHMPALDDTFVSGSGSVTLNGHPVSVSEETDPEAMTVVPSFWWDHSRRDEYAAAAREVVNRFGDLHRLGSAQSVLSYVACGAYDAVITNTQVEPWDSIAGVHMVRAAGGTVTDRAGDRWRHDAHGLVAASPGAHPEALAATRAVENHRND